MKQQRKRNTKKNQVVYANRTIKNIALAQYLIGLFVCLVCLYTITTGLHFRSGKNVLAQQSNTQIKTEYIQANRGVIYDRNQEVIAQDVDTYTMYAILDSSRLGIGNVPAYVVDKEETAKVLSDILGSTPEAFLEYLNQDLYQTYFGYIGKKVTSSQRDEIVASGLPGIEFERNIDRVYPTGVFASHLIGFAQYDEVTGAITGRMGIEQYFNNTLTGQNGVKKSLKDANNYTLPGTSYYEKTSVDGNDVYLTLDKNVQVALESALQQTIDKLGATKAWSVIMEVETGRILAWSSAPSFDLNERVIENYLNMPAEYAFEPGSVMKPFTYAAAIDTGNYDPDKLVQTGAFHVGLDANGKIIRLPSSVGAIGTINDANRKGWGMISYDEGMIRSSNTVIAQLLTDFLPLDTFANYLDAFKLFEPVEVAGMNSVGGVLNYTYPFEKLTTAFGQGSSMTTLNLLQAYSAIFNEGVMVKPYFIDKVVSGEDGSILEQYETEIAGTPIKASTANQVLELMQRVVEDEVGTAKIYALNDTTVAAKTGTAEIFKDGKYSNTYVSSVMAAAPADDPKVMMYYAFENSTPTRLSGEYYSQAMMQALLSLNVAGDKHGESVENDEDQTYQEFTMANYRNHSVEYTVDKFDPYLVKPVVIGDGSVVVDQYPKAGSLVNNNQTIFLLTDGTTIKMPNMVGWTRKDVTAFWQLTGLPIAIDGFGCVVEQNFKPGDIISKEYEIVVKLD
ncbi:MAG: penicillin-binding protein [Erysipelotrichaceae bacterium]